MTHKQTRVPTNPATRPVQDEVTWLRMQIRELELEIKELTLKLNGSHVDPL